MPGWAARRGSRHSSLAPDESMTTSIKLGRGEAAALFLSALVWFLPGIWWGLPVDTPELYMRLWGVDELGPHGGLNVTRAILGADAFVTPQYPLAHSLVQALFVWPYALAVLAADNVGLPQQTESLAVLVLLHRLPSVLMAAGTVVAGAALVRRLTGSRGASWFSAAAICTIGPVTYYGRTSNVDVGALFWSMVTLWLASTAIMDGLTARRAAGLGLAAAAGIATKDQQYAWMAGVALIILASHFHASRGAMVRAHSWRAPVVALAVSIGAYLLLSGAVLLPAWFAGHLEFIRHGSAQEFPDDLRRLAGTYYSYPPTVTGYWQLLGEGMAQVQAAVGAPVLLLAGAGIGVLLRGNPGILALVLVPVLTLVAGVLLPVRFVLPRFLLPVDLTICLLAGVAVAAALASARWRVAGQVMAVAGLAWSAVRGADLAWQMHRDSRYEAAAWIERNLQPGDTLAYYGARRKLPALHPGILATPAPGQYLPGTIYGASGPLTETPQFIIVIPQLHTEPIHEWSVPDSLFRALLDGSAGYAQVLAIQTPALFPRPRNVAPGVNPPVRVFARQDMLGRLAGPARIELPDPPVPAPPR